MRWAAPIAALTVLAACDGAPEPPPPEATPPPAPVRAPVEGFAHEAGVEVSGFYLPTSEVQVGDLRLSHLFIGDDETFEAWKAVGGRGPTNFPPILLQFDDLSSDTIPNDLGGQTPSEIVRALPSGYGVSSRTVRFAATEPRLGAVTFEGEFVQPGFDQARAGQAPTGPVLRGTLTIDGQIYEGQGFAWTAAP